jgi:hypothetical protein
MGKYPVSCITVFSWCSCHFTTITDGICIKAILSLIILHFHRELRKQREEAGSKKEEEKKKREEAKAAAAARIQAKLDAKKGGKGKGKNK